MHQSDRTGSGQPSFSILCILEDVYPRRDYRFTTGYAFQYNGIYEAAALVGQLDAVYPWKRVERYMKGTVPLMDQRYLAVYVLRMFNGSRQEQCPELISGVKGRAPSLLAVALYQTRNNSGRVELLSQLPIAGQTNNLEHPALL